MIISKPCLAVTNITSRKKRKRQSEIAMIDEHTLLLHNSLGEWQATESYTITVFYLLALVYNWFFLQIVGMNAV